MTKSNEVSRRRFVASAGLTAAMPAAFLGQLPAAVGEAAPVPPIPSHKYEDLRPEQFYAEFERAPIAYFACGAMEEHGLHLALGTDLYVAYEICLRAAKISGGIVFPPVPFAPAYMPPGLSRTELRQKTKELFAPSLWVSGDLCRQIYVELLESLADLGFKSCIAFGGHYPADKLLAQIEEEQCGRVGGMRFWGGGTVSILADHLKEEVKRDPLSGGHGTMWETSLVMAIRPDWVDLSRVPHIPDYSRPSQLQKNIKERLDYIAKANAQYGQREIDLAVQRTAKRAKELLG